MLDLISKAKKLVNVLSQGFCTNEAEKTVVFLCRATQPMPTAGCCPFANYTSYHRYVSLHLNVIQHA